jgi:hypothetical protein
MVSSVNSVYSSNFQNQAVTFKGNKSQAIKKIAGNIAGEAHLFSLTAVPTYMVAASNGASHTSAAAIGVLAGATSTIASHMRELLSRLRMTSVIKELKPELSEQEASKHALRNTIPTNIIGSILKKHD